MIYTVLIGKFQQSVVFEGIGKLFFSCDRVGHRHNNCCYTIKPQSSGSFVQVEDSRPLNGEVRSPTIGNAPTSDTDTGWPVTLDTNPTTDAGTLIVPDHSLEDNYGPWLVVTHRKQANKNYKKTNGSTSPKAPLLASNRVHYLAGNSLEKAQPKDSKRKPSGLESPPNALPFSFVPNKPSSQGNSKRNHKGKKENIHVGAVPLPKSDAPLDQSSPLIYAPTRPCSSNSPALFDGTFKSKWDFPREMGFKDGGNSDRKSNFNEQPPTDSSLALNGKSMVGFQFRDSGGSCSEGHLMEECAEAISTTAFVRIRPKLGATAEEVPGVPIDPDVSDREPSTVQGDYGGSSTLCNLQVGEGVQMDCEEGGEAPFSTR